MENQQFYIEAASRAAKSAAVKVVNNARRNNKLLPIWKNNQIVFEIPEVITLESKLIEVEVLKTEN